MLYNFRVLKLPACHHLSSFAVHAQRVRTFARSKPETVIVAAVLHKLEPGGHFVTRVASNDEGNIDTWL